MDSLGENFNDEDDEVFNDTALLANLENSAFRVDSGVFEENKNTQKNNTGNTSLNVSALCCDEEISGYDKLTGRTWIYPTNYPVRDYQFNIIKASILQNTLVSLPTGLGKTFIAAVIMYNFYRWYPLGKIIFTAPTRPLVAQQIDACYNIIAIPPKDTIEMTGHMQVNTRKGHWETKRVFFATPQVIYNDIKSGICPGEKIRCLVIDEAHRARGNYAYCQIVSTLTEMGHKTYRLLALSATPGSKVDDVITVVKNLHITHLELRTENCIDVARYSHSRKINTVIVQLGPELTKLRQQYVEILDDYARRLKQLNILPQNLGNLSKGRVVMLYKEFQCKERGARHPQHNIIMKDFTLLIALFHGLELLVKHGTRVFLNFFDDHPEKSWIEADNRLVAFLERLRDDLGVNPLSLDRSILPDGTIPEMPQNLCFGHPKFYKLKEIMLEHFEKAKRSGVDTRAIVFCEYRESVNLVHCLLLQCRPLITPLMFVGQGASGKDGKTVVSQKQQMRVMRNFREGVCNTLVATCVAEEGLDVGSVDLILCFDISTRSPVRLVQRCGRTGRERGGQVYILVTEGREHQTLLDCMRQRDGLNNKILHSREVSNNLYKSNPRMVPHGFMPECQKMYITVAQKSEPKTKSKETPGSSKKGQKDLRNMFRQSTNNRNSHGAKTGHLITEEEFHEIFPDGYPYTEPEKRPMEYWCLDKDSIKMATQPKEADKLLPWLEWQRTLQNTAKIGHSRDSEVLSEILQYCDAKRFELPPSTQHPAFTSQDLKTQNVALSPVKSKNNKKKQKLLKSPSKKDGDIRALFTTATKSTKSYTKILNDLGVQNDGTLSTRLINLLVELSLDNAKMSKECYLCQNVCDCKTIEAIRKSNNELKTPFNLKGELKLPDVKLLDDVKAETIAKCAKLNNENIYFNIFSQKSVSDESNENRLRNCEIKDDIEKHTEKREIVEENFDLGDIEDIFADSSPEIVLEQTVEKQNKVYDKEEKVFENEEKVFEKAEKVLDKEEKVFEKDSSKPKETLEFFGLDSIDDIFADYDENSDEKSKQQITTTDKADDVKNEPMVKPLSPSILSGRHRIQTEHTSPILSSQVRKHQLSINKTQPITYPSVSTAKKQLNMNSVFDISLYDESVSKFKNPSCTPSYLSNTNNKTMFTVTQLVEMINKSEFEKSAANSNNVSKNTEMRAVDIENERSSSPILLTQADKRKVPNVLNQINLSKNTNSQPKKNESLIILDSDSESDDTETYNIEKYCDDSKPGIDLQSFRRDFNVNINNESDAKDELKNQENQQKNKKRKFSLDNDESITASPYFSKKQKLISDNKMSLSIRDKILAAISSSHNAPNETNKINNTNNVFNAVNFPSPSTLSQKENEYPTKLPNEQKRSDENYTKTIGTNGIDLLQRFRRDVKNSPKRILGNKNEDTKLMNAKKQITFSDSDDDFVNEMDSSNNRSKLDISTSSLMTNHKVRKKKRRKNVFLDEEAEISDDGADDSGDELSDESIGSIIDFICDDNDNVTHTEADMHAHYLKSVRSPVKNGVFKIPQLPNIRNNLEIFSQFVEEDSYEMDSFCVDSHVGLTQVHEESELDLAEKLLEAKKRKRKRKMVNLETTFEEKGDSPIVKKKNRNVKRQILSDSDESS